MNNTCRKGLHEFTPENTIQKKNGQRTCRKCNQIKSSQQTSRLKRIVLSFYGPNKEARRSWPKCEVSDIDMLCLDHINDDGALERKSGIASKGKAFYRRLRREKFPPGYQTLCYNHNQKKRIQHIARCLAS